MFVALHDVLQLDHTLNSAGCTIANLQLYQTRISCMLPHLIHFGLGNNVSALCEQNTCVFSIHCAACPCSLSSLLVCQSCPRQSSRSQSGCLSWPAGGGQRSMQVGHLRVCCCVLTEGSTGPHWHHISHRLLANARVDRQPTRKWCTSLQ